MTAHPAGGGKPPRTPITRTAYLAALDRAALSLPWAAPAALDRLRRDAGGKAEAAINVLRATDPEQASLVLFSTLQAATLALDNAAVRATLTARAEKYRTAAAALETVLDLNRDPAISIPNHSTLALRDLRKFLIDTAQSWDKMPGKAGVSQKPDAAFITLRQIRDRLFRNCPAPHEPLRLIAEAALGIDISRDVVTSALRAPRTSGNSAKVKREKLPL